jgi:endonuclease YncB( thermonuclease family)
MVEIRQRLLAFLLFVLTMNACNNEGENGLMHPKEIEEAEAAGRLLRGKAVGISDGDTFRLLMEDNKNIRVRLHGIDAPEKGQDYSTQARQALSDLVFSKEVAVIQKTKDRYGRVVGIVYHGDTNVNEELLKTGMVWHYTEYDKNPKWASLQTKAKEQNAGLWSKPDPTPPWQWRKTRREENVEAD